MMRSLGRKLTVKSQASPAGRKDNSRLGAARENEPLHPRDGAGDRDAATHWTALQSRTNLAGREPELALSHSRSSMDKTDREWDHSQPAPLSPIPLGPPSSFNFQQQQLGGAGDGPQRSTSLARKASLSIKRSLSRKNKQVVPGHPNGVGAHDHAFMMPGQDEVPVVPEMMRDLGDTVDTFDLAKIAAAAAASGSRAVDVDPIADRSGFSKAQGMGSYTWLKTAGGQPATMLVPGCPDVWNPLHEVNTLRPSCQPPRRPDMIDYNSLMHPSSSTEPMFRALATGSEPLPQLITDRTNLVRLFALVHGSSESPQTQHHHHHQQDFRIDIECVGSAVVMSRWEPMSVMRSPSTNRQQQVMGLSYAPAWLDRVTQSPAAGGEDIDKEAGTFAMVKYRFGDLDMLVRFEVDAALPQAAAKTESSDLPTPPPHSSPTLHVRSPLRPNETATGSPPHSSLVTLKLVSARTQPDWQALYLSLVFAQLRQAYIGRNDKGDIASFPVEHVSLDDHPQMMAAAADTARSMRKLQVLLAQIQACCARSGSSSARGAAGPHACVLVRDGQISIVKIKDRKAGTGLSEMARARILAGQEPVNTKSHSSDTVSRSKSVTQAIRKRF